MADVFVEIGQVVITSLVSLMGMFLLTRWGGKRQISQMSPFDYLNAVTTGSIAAELATNLEQWYRPVTAMVVYRAGDLGRAFYCLPQYLYAQFVERAVAGIDGERHHF